MATSATRANLTLKRVEAHADRVSLQPISWRTLFDQEQERLSQLNAQQSKGLEAKPTKKQDGTSSDGLRSSMNDKKSADVQASPLSKAESPIRISGKTEDEDRSVSKDALNERASSPQRGPSTEQSKQGKTTMKESNKKGDEEATVSKDKTSSGVEASTRKDDEERGDDQQQEEEEDQDELAMFKASGEPFIDLANSKERARWEMLSLLKDKLIEDVKWCWASPSLSVIPIPPKSTQDLLGFYRDFVHKNTPCVLRGLNICEWPSNWNWKRLGMGRKQVRVNATPTGRGDAVVPDSDNPSQRVFVKPEERMMDFESFLDWVTSNQNTEKDDVLYLSAQNDSLRDEFTDLIEEGFAPPSLPLGDLLFGKQADAVNLWIGNQRAVSSMHRDTTYENLYCVLRGTKVFHLLPPCCAPFLGEVPYPNAQYRKSASDGRWVIEKEKEGETTPWIELDVAEPVKAMEICPEFAMIADLVQRVEVKQGETLFLPAGWFHRVTQTEPTVAVNYWYDRDFNSTWVLTEAIEYLVENAK